MATGEQETHRALLQVSKTQSVHTDMLKVIVEAVTEEGPESPVADLLERLAAAVETLAQKIDAQTEVLKMLDTKPA